MTALRPEPETDASYGDQSYEASGALGGEWYGEGTYQEGYPRGYQEGHGGGFPAGHPGTGHPGGYPQTPYEQPYEHPAARYEHPTAPYQQPPAEVPLEPGEVPYEPPRDPETVALRLSDTASAAGASASASGASSGVSSGPAAAGGRAARRKAAKRRGGRHGGGREMSQASASAEESVSQGPLSRVEARRQARLRKPSPSVVASRAIGEVFITTGVLMLLFVTYQLWWTNVRAHAQAGDETSTLQNDWASGKRAPGSFEPGQGFAILHIPKLDVVVPIAEGVSNKRVLDKGMVGHYGEAPLKTAMPDAKTGNFGLAAHRNTHGEPFRYINRLQSGDDVVVETQSKYFVYKVTSMLPVTQPSNTSVLDAVPRGSGFTGPGRYITLTTCTPEFTSKYRLIVWGKMVEERSRSKGKPDALVE
ncbi:class E sortase [Streptomyces sp. V3I7]|uniref:class E sortase n=1 Tax=Streptomyces sp. V3I7 TaxID=3042278 RepID=UPI00278AD398|nr:class E sortase [Streptomyces sp. V3I7]MDQ0991905.1 sortase A [Streptomyces sp. V3I7]